MLAANCSTVPQVCLIGSWSAVPRRIPRLRRGIVHQPRLPGARGLSCEAHARAAVGVTVLLTTLDPAKRWSDHVRPEGDRL